MILHDDNDNEEENDVFFINFFQEAPQAAILFSHSLFFDSCAGLKVQHSLHPPLNLGGVMAGKGEAQHNDTGMARDRSGPGEINGTG